MYEIKVNLVITLPGRVTMSEKDVLRKVRKPLLNKAGKQIVSKSGEPVWHTVWEEDPSKTTLCTVNIGKETLQFRTRNAYPAQQRINLCTEAYENFISTDVPEHFKIPNSFKAPTVISEGGKRVNKYPGIPLKKQAWLEMTKKERLEWHLKDISKFLGGTLESYKVFDD